MITRARRKATILCLVFFGLLGCGELQSKQEWSILQTAEFQHRTGVSASQRVATYVYEGYRAVGIAADDSQRRVWILLNPRFEPLVKEMPAASYHLTRAELDQILRDGNVRAEVVEHLKGKLSPL
jgi:hypothetical protein